jgi:hypothetical protein
MPYKHHEPVDLAEMDKHRYDGHHSICQQLRDIYHMTDNEPIRQKARVAMSMAKAMHERLKKYRMAEDTRRAADGMPDGM